MPSPADFRRSFGLAQGQILGKSLEWRVRHGCLLLAACPCCHTASLAAAIQYPLLHHCPFMQIASLRVGHAVKEQASSPGSRGALPACVLGFASMAAGQRLSRGNGSCRDPHEAACRMLPLRLQELEPRSRVMLSRICILILCRTITTSFLLSSPCTGSPTLPHGAVSSRRKGGAC